MDLRGGSKPAVVCPNGRASQIEASEEQFTKSKRVFRRLAETQRIDEVMQGLWAMPSI